MDNEPNRDLSHHEAADLVAVLLREKGWTALREHTLPSGVRADVFSISPEGVIEIFEVKSYLKSSLLDNAMHKYAHWCNRLWCAVPHLTQAQCEEGNDLLAWKPPRTMVGIVGVYRDAMVVYRRPHHQPMHARLYNITTGLRG